VREDIDMRTMLRILCAILSLAPTVFAADVTGTWTGTLSPDRGGGQPLVLILIQTGATIAGSGGPNQDVQYPIEKGTIKEDRVTLEVVQAPRNRVYSFDLKLSGNQMKGRAELKEAGQTLGMATIDFKREPAAPPAKN
jgi:hypothetical protein